MLRLITRRSEPLDDGPRFGISARVRLVSVMLSVTLYSPRSRIVDISGAFGSSSLDKNAANAPVRRFRISKNASRNRYTLPEAARVVSPIAIVPVD